MHVLVFFVQATKRVLQLKLSKMAWSECPCCVLKICYWLGNFGLLLCANTRTPGCCNCLPAYHLWITISLLSSKQHICRFLNTFFFANQISEYWELICISFLQAEGVACCCQHQGSGCHFEPRCYCLVANLINMVMTASSLHHTLHAISFLAFEDEVFFIAHGPGLHQCVAATLSPLTGHHLQSRQARQVERPTRAARCQSAPVFFFSPLYCW
jgi:hypothetical protein